MRKNENGIINLDISTGGGTHWVCYYNDPKYDFVEYFDPFDKTLNNHSLTYKIGIETHHIPLDDGNYTVRDLNNTIRNTLTKDEFQFGINFDTSWIVLKLESGYSIDFSQSELHKILGFEQRIYDQPEETARYLANISRGIDDIHIHCDIIHAILYNDRTSDVLYSFTPSNPPGSLIKIDEINPLFVSVNRSDCIHSIRMYITDQDDNIINLNKQRVIYRLILSSINEL
ncbi:uncharacterized protein TNCT_317971 [Trichonephila clavata]|uniref:Uncharacterized protein n=1 Tax=Trichonephila clavata TaxID=2740835 RepID=A0A8X6H732_TRICU|nr:uncharacterized protein TNCT_317971 [Trichonephila clavata]